MYTIKAKYDGVILKPEQPVHLEEEYDVIVTFIEPVKRKVNVGKKTDLLSPPMLNTIGWKFNREEANER